MQNSIALNLIDLAATEGKDSAINVAEDLQSSLESLAEMGSHYERAMCSELLDSVQFGIQQIKETNAVEIRRQHLDGELTDA